MNWLEQCKSEAEALTQEQRQKYLDLIHEGKTIGEARDIMGLTLEAGCGIINMNINSHEFKTLSKETK